MPAMIRKDRCYLSAWSIMSRQMEKRKPEADGLRRGREIFQQKNTCDRFSHHYDIIWYMKKKILIGVIVLTILIVFFPKQIYVYNGQVPEKFNKTCQGFYFDYPNGKPRGAVASGYCFGIVKKKVNEKWVTYIKDSLKYNDVLEIEPSALPKGVYVEKNPSDISLLHNGTDEPLYVVHALKDSNEYFTSEIPLGYVTSYKLTKDNLYFRGDYKYFLTGEKAFYHPTPAEWRSYGRTFIGINNDIADMMTPTDDPSIFTMTLYYKNKIILVPVKHTKQINREYSEDAANSLVNRMLHGGFER